MKQCNSTRGHKLQLKIDSLLNNQGADLPEWGPLPSRGVDRFGFSRSGYYTAEKNGDIKLCRVRQPGNMLGKVLVNYASVRVYLAKLCRAQNENGIARPAAKTAPAAVETDGAEKTEGSNAHGITA